MGISKKHLKTHRISWHFFQLFIGSFQTHHYPPWNFHRPWKWAIQKGNDRVPTIHFPTIHFHVGTPPRPIIEALAHPSCFHPSSSFQWVFFLIVVWRTERDICWNRVKFHESNMIDGFQSKNLPHLGKERCINFENYRLDTQNDGPWKRFVLQLQDMAIFGMYVGFSGVERSPTNSPLNLGWPKFLKFSGVEKSLGSFSGRQFPLDLPGEPTVQQPNWGFQSWSGIKRCNAGTVTWCSSKERNETVWCRHMCRLGRVEGVI